MTARRTGPAFRPLEPWDLGPVASLVRAALAEVALPADVGGLGLAVPNLGRDPLEPDDRGRRVGSWVVLDGERVVGTLVVRREEDGDARVMRLFLAPDVRGRGWGTAALELAEEWAASAGCARLAARVHPRQVAMENLLRRRGYVPGGSRGGDRAARAGASVEEEGRWWSSPVLEGDGSP